MYHSSSVLPRSLRLTTISGNLSALERLVGLSKDTRPTVSFVNDVMGVVFANLSPERHPSQAIDLDNASGFAWLQTSLLAFRCVEQVYHRLETIQVRCNGRLPALIQLIKAFREKLTSHIWPSLGVLIHEYVLDDFKASFVEAQMDQDSAFRTVVSVLMLLNTAAGKDYLLFIRGALSTTTKFFLRWMQRYQRVNDASDHSVLRLFASLLEGVEGFGDELMLHTGSLRLLIYVIVDGIRDSKTSSQFIDAMRILNTVLRSSGAVRAVLAIYPTILQAILHLLYRRCRSATQMTPPVLAGQALQVARQCLRFAHTVAALSSSDNHRQMLKHRLLECLLIIGVHAPISENRDLAAMSINILQDITPSLIHHIVISSVLRTLQATSLSSIQGIVPPSSTGLRAAWTDFLRATRDRERTLRLFNQKFPSTKCCRPKVFSYT